MDTGILRGQVLSEAQAMAFFHNKVDEREFFSGTGMAQGYGGGSEGARELGGGCGSRGVGEGTESTDSRLSTSEFKQASSVAPHKCYTICLCLQAHELVPVIPHYLPRLSCYI